MSWTIKTWMVSLLALVSKKPRPLAGTFRKMLETLKPRRDASVNGLVGDQEFSGRWPSVWIPDTPSLHAFAAVGADFKHKGIMLDPSTLRPEALEASMSFLSNPSVERAKDVPLFGSAVFMSREGPVIGRDPLGSRPLFVGEGDFVGFSSEPQCLRQAGLEPVRTLPPSQLLTVISRTITHLNIKLGNGVPWSKPLAVNKLIDALRAAIRPLPDPRALLFSGGIDSLILAKICEELGKTTLICAGLEGCKDLVRAESAAKGLSSPLEMVQIIPQDIPRELSLLSDITCSTNPMNLAIALPIKYAACKARELGIATGVAGQGADELFGGYNRYLSDPDPESSMIRDLLGLHSRGMDSFNLSARSEGVELFLPYIDEGLLRCAMTIPVNLKIRGGVRKAILREAGLELGLREEDVAAPKCAIQYGSGVNKHVARILRRRPK